MRHRGTYATAIEMATLRAMDELRRMTIRQVQIDTAIKWGGRAIAAKAMGREADAHEYAHESLEHVALADDPELQRLLRQVFTSRGIVE